MLKEKKIAVIFPGVGYNANKPLLYHTIKLAAKAGYEIREVNYSLLDANEVHADMSKKDEYVKRAGEQTKELLKDVKLNDYDEVLVVGKSIGTVVGSEYMKANGIKARYVLFTPVKETFDYKYEDAIVVHGTRDPWAKTADIREACEKARITPDFVADANHSLECGNVSKDIYNLLETIRKVDAFICKSGNPNLKQAHNPFMPHNEYVPDGEPYTFGDRVYLFGSHDKFSCDVYCPLDYVCYSAPIDDLSDWRYEGVTVYRNQDPSNTDGEGCLFAPDVAQGPDGRFYMYYALNSNNSVSVAVCDEPAGHYEFYGYVHRQDGTLLGARPEDENQFDPGVLVEDGKVYMFTGFCQPGLSNVHGPMVTVLDSDMLTVVSEPKFIAPSEYYGKGTSFEGHEFFEAPSIRKIENTYYFIYSSIHQHELCYATSDAPTGPFTYRGVIISNADIHIDSYKPADKTAYYTANNHGSVEKIGDDWYIFYHRHTNGTNYARQACFEKIKVLPDGTIPQVQMTTNCGLEPLRGEGMYPSYLACNLFNAKEAETIPWCGWLSDEHPKITEEQGFNEESTSYIANMSDTSTAGFKFFDIKGLKKIGIWTRGYGDGRFEVRTDLDAEPIAVIPFTPYNDWTYVEADAKLADGVYSLFFTFVGNNTTGFKAFNLVCE